ncbi:MAG: serine--tRNA ligase [Acidimicrobiia bacterium]|nr:serine--tRNA ligase [Acidimicrobiia bacterium]
MINAKLLKDDKEYRERIEAKKVDPKLIDDFLEVELKRGELIVIVDDLRAQKNLISKEIGKANPDERKEKIESANEIKKELDGYETTLSELETKYRSLILQIPNPIDSSVPVGQEEDFEIVKIVGEQYSAPKMDHADYGEHMGWVLSEQGANISGSRFAYLAGDAVRLEFALVQFTMGLLAKHGFTPIVPPVLVRESSMEEAGFFPTDENQVYHIEEDNLYLVGTSEVPLAGIHRGEIIDEKDMPKKYCGFSSCFRREAGTYGKDTRGIFRVHQFDKVEMFIYSTPEDSWKEFEKILAIEEEICQALGFSYRVIASASQDLGSATTKKYDVEVWLPSEGAYRELTSCSHYLDFASRRGNIRVKGENGTELVHTLNGTAIAIGRGLTFLMERAQKENGDFEIPEALRSFMGGEETLSKRK